MKKLLIFALSLVICLSSIACGDKKEECFTCNGDGVRMCYMISRMIAGAPGAPLEHTSDCYVCGGDGEMICNACNGTGFEYK